MVGLVIMAQLVLEQIVAVAVAAQVLLVCLRLVMLAVMEALALSVILLAR